MSPSRPFIQRPIGTSLLMAGLLLVGAVAYKQLPVSALPQVDYPTIQSSLFIREPVPTLWALPSLPLWNGSSAKSRG